MAFATAEEAQVFLIRRVLAFGLWSGLSKRVLLAGAALSVLLVGCATQQEVSVLQKQIWAAHRDMENGKTQMAQLEQRVVWFYGI